MNKKNAKPETQSSTGMFFTVSYLVMFAVGYLVLYLGNMWFPHQIVLGTMSVTPMWALCLGAGKLALAATLTMPFFNEWEARRGRILESYEWMIGYAIINFIAIWLLGRAADILGVGFSSWLVVLVLALVLDLIQGIAMMTMEKIRVAYLQ